MLLAIAILVAAKTPVLPAGVAPEFQASILKVEEQLSAGQFAQAQAALTAFPKSNISFVWDESNVPVQERDRLRRLRASSINNWKYFAKDLTFTEAKAAGLRIAFSKQNSINPETRNIVPIEIKRNGGSVTATISLTREAAASPATDADLQKSITMAYGIYLGVGVLPYGASAMTPTEASTMMTFSIAPVDAQIATGNLAVLAELRKLAESKTKVQPRTSSIVVPKSLIELGSIFKGEAKEFEVEIKNNGTGSGKFWIRPDCGCVIAPGTLEVAPNSSVKVPIKFTSDEFSGKTRKRLYLVSNDPKGISDSFEFEIQINFAYEFFSKLGNVIVVEDGVTDGEIVMAFNGEPFEVQSATINGLTIPVSVEPWTGRGGLEAEKERKGYKFKFQYPDAVPPGRSPVALVLTTDSPNWRVIRHNFSLQKGIAALPETVSMGRLTGPKESKTIVSRPGRPFKITKVQSNSPYFSVEVEPDSKPDEYRLKINYLDNAPIGSLSETLTITTDDPAQPTITVAISGRVQ